MQNDKTLNELLKKVNHHMRDMLLKAQQQALLDEHVKTFHNYVKEMNNIMAKQGGDGRNFPNYASGVAKENGLGVPELGAILGELRVDLKSINADKFLGPNDMKELAEMANNTDELKAQMDYPAPRPGNPTGI